MTGAGWESVLGGVRSGKSRYAEQQARASGLRVVYIATAIAQGDAELDERIRRHRSYRPADWVTVEEPAALGTALRAHAGAQCCLLVECLTLWLAHLLTSGQPIGWSPSARACCAPWWRLRDT